MPTPRQPASRWCWRYGAPPISHGASRNWSRARSPHPPPRRCAGGRFWVAATTAASVSAQHGTGSGFSAHSTTPTPPATGWPGPPRSRVGKTAPSSGSPCCSSRSRAVGAGQVTALRSPTPMSHRPRYPGGLAHAGLDPPPARTPVLVALARCRGLTRSGTWMSVCGWAGRGATTAAGHIQPLA